MGTPLGAPPGAELSSQTRLNAMFYFTCVSTHFTIIVVPFDCIPTGSYSFTGCALFLFLWTPPKPYLGMLYPYIVTQQVLLPSALRLGVQSGSMPAW